MKIRSGIFCLLLAGLSLIAWTACGGMSAKEVARIPIKAVGMGEEDWRSAGLHLDKGTKLWFWTDIDMEYADNTRFRYVIQVIRDKDTTGFLELDPFDRKITLGKKEVSLMGHTTTSFSGQMNFLEIKESGDYTFRTFLSCSDPDGVTINKADLVLKK